MKGRKDRMKKERGARSDSGCQSRYKREKLDTFRSLDDIQQYLNSLSTFLVSNMEHGTVRKCVKIIYCNPVSKNPGSSQILYIGFVKLNHMLSQGF